MNLKKEQMIKPFQTTFRVSYSDTDQMGFMHHSNYLKYLETARWKLFRHIGIQYSEIEKEGTILPVISVSIKYNHPAHYDQKILVTFPAGNNSAYHD
jgi:acyl-CoA thioester hydrolase